MAMLAYCQEGLMEFLLSMRWLVTQRAQEDLFPHLKKELIVDTSHQNSGTTSGITK